MTDGKKKQINMLNLH